MIKDDSVYLEDMYLHIVKLEKTISDLNIEKLNENEAMQSHIIRLLEIIGEASIKISGALKSKYEEVPWARIRGMRNILVHDYGNISIEVVWNTAKDAIPPLKVQIRNIINDVNPQILLNYE